MKNLKIGERIIPLWLVAVLLISGIGVAVLAEYVWKTLTVPIKVEEPLEILDYPSELRLFPGENKTFEITIQNHASVDYSVILYFSLSNMSYQTEYVSFSDYIYTIIPGQQNITAWFTILAHAPPLNDSLAITFARI